MVFAELGDLQLRAGLAGCSIGGWWPGRFWIAPCGPTPRELTPSAWPPTPSSRLVATLGGVDGGLDRFLATGPCAIPGTGCLRPMFGRRSPVRSRAGEAR